MSGDSARSMHLLCASVLESWIDQLGARLINGQHEHNLPDVVLVNCMHLAAVVTAVIPSKGGSGGSIGVNI